MHAHVMSPSPREPKLPRTEAARWAAVASRDRTADGHFFYSVGTTGIYCRPSCGSRLPLRKNVRFHESAKAAERSGFRPCKRCRPERARSEERGALLVRRACREIHEGMDRGEPPPTLLRLAKAAGWSPFHFHRVFKLHTGLTPKGYVDALRRERTQRALKRAPRVTDAIYEAGFASSGRFYERTSTMLGMTPRAFKKGGESTALRFAVGKCSFGAVLVAATSRGLAAVLLGDDADALIRDLESRFPRAVLEAGDREFEACVAAVVGFIDGQGKTEVLPLDPRGTSFQRRVWNALAEIPPGSTVTYSELAAKLGAPGSARAVAGACAKNPIAILVPCHRVIREDGGLSGYRWGVDRKRALLTREGAPLARGPAKS